MISFCFSPRKCVSPRGKFVGRAVANEDFGSS